MESPSRRRTYDFPKPDADLAEWTNRIKALQREVDADEEAEQRRLEEEIRASRIARSRRSGGVRYEGAMADIASSPLLSGESKSPDIAADSAADRQTNQSEALRKLMGESNVYVPPASTVGSGQPVSLASFIGGRATGPMLKKHAPQQDAHDPTMFEQRSLANIKAAPHPIFGSKGVAMPGLTGKSQQQQEEDSPRVKSFVATREESKPRSAEWARERTISSPSPQITQKTANPAPSEPARMHTKSTSPPLRTSSSSGSEQSFRPPVSAKPMTMRQLSSKSSQPDLTNNSPRIISSTPPLRPKTPPTPYMPSSTASPRPSITSSPVPGLARPIQAQARSSPTLGTPGNAHASASKNASPAFLRPPPEKDLTPSLSRLQGRGFVQSLVKLSGELEAASGGSPGGSANNTPEKGGPSPTKRQSSVLDRWQPQVSSPAQTLSPGAPPLRKAKTIGSSTPSVVPNSQPSPSSPSPGARFGQQALKSSSLPEKAPKPPTATKPKSVQGDVQPSPGTPGLGSSNTLFSYIKPTKTGDNPITDDVQPDSAKGSAVENANNGLLDQEVDEMGMRPRPRTKSSPSAQAAFGQGRLRTKSDAGVPVPSGRPLSHPTRDRARRPRKHNGQSEDERKTPSQGADVKGTAVADYESNMMPAPEKTQSSPQIIKGRTQDENQVVQPVKKFNDIESVAKDGKTSSQLRGENIRRLQDTWVAQGPIGVKEVRKVPRESANVDNPSSSPGASNWKNKTTMRALPGLAKVSPPSPTKTPPLTDSSEMKAAPPASTRHPRIPSTGSRATVMDVAQTLGALTPAPSHMPPQPSSPIIVRTDSPSEAEEFDPNDPGGWEKTVTPAAIKAERRRSNYDKYSNFMMPVLPEEKTPTPSPAATLSKAEAATFAVANNAAKKVTVDLLDQPLPPLDLARLWDTTLPVYTPDEDLRTVSVEVLCINGSTATAVTCDMHILYDAEMVVVIQRAKSKSSGLVVTNIWEWRGRKYDFSESGERKVAELAKRFNSEPVKCEQFREPEELVHVLGNRIAIRQGTRSLWSSENTTMHIVRSFQGMIVIDEVELNVRNLCSGFSFCISVLDSLWVWHGRGSSDAERSAAVAYSNSLANGADKSVQEVEEGQEDDMFWVFLGEDDYSKADYWRWKNSAHTNAFPETRIWRMAPTQEEIEEVGHFPSGPVAPKEVLVLYLPFEVFILVGEHARALRQEIMVALEFSKYITASVSEHRPFRPPVHVVILPSRLPLELCSSIRGLQEDTLNESGTPEHMNLLTADEAQIHIRLDTLQR